MLKKLSGASAVALVVLASAVVGGGVAQADPGFCGERVSEDQGVDLSIIYTAHNRCSFPIRVAVYLQGVHRRAQPECQEIAPNGYATYNDVYADQNWLVQNC